RKPTPRSRREPATHSCSGPGGLGSSGGSRRGPGQASADVVLQRPPSLSVPAPPRQTQGRRSPRAATPRGGGKGPASPRAPRRGGGTDRRSCLVAAQAALAAAARMPEPGRPSTAGLRAELEELRRGLEALRREVATLQAAGAEPAPWPDRLEVAHAFRGPVEGGGARACGAPCACSTSAGRGAPRAGSCWATSRGSRRRRSDSCGPCERPARGGGEVPEEVTARVLDAGEMYPCSSSLWDAAVFVGHPCLGAGVSVMLTFVFVLNFAVQVTFCRIVGSYMLGDGLDDSYLDSLLGFRLGIAHQASFADMVGHRSLARMVCDMDPTLHTAAAQTSFLFSYEGFLGGDGYGGPVLMTLAQLLWIALIMSELRSVFDQWWALLSMSRGPHTLVLMSGLRVGDDGGPPSRSDLKYLERRSVTVRLVRLSTARLSGVFFGVILPRLFVAGLLAIIGVRFLGKTNRMEDLVLNAVALSFIMDIDEDFFKTLLPRRVQTLVANLEPLPLNEARVARRFPSLGPALTVIVILGGLAATGLLVLVPFYSKLHQAKDILCSGDIDFIFSSNAASGVVHVTRSVNRTGITETERMILEVARPTLLSDGYWSVAPELVALSHSEQARVAVEPNASSLDDVGFHEHSFQKVALIGESTVAEAADTLPCKDFATGQTFWAMQASLRQLTGDSTVGTCADASKLDLCGKPESTQLRALCPFQCGCMIALSSTGLFGTPAFGCPTSCVQYRAVYDEIVQGYPCEDTGEGNFSAVTDYMPNTYEVSLTIGTRYGLYRYSDFRSYYLAYVRGLQEYILRSAIVLQGVQRNIESLVILMSVPQVWEGSAVVPFSALEMYSHVIGGGFFEELAAGNWTLLPGIPHPRGLRGCDYLASYEVSLVLNVALCEEGVTSSIRPWCPRACQCQSGMPGCPAACEQAFAITDAG
ncbi:unnamed protein product, partial [Prorocentrum cordatum]